MRREARPAVAVVASAFVALVACRSAPEEQVGSADAAAAASPTAAHDEAAAAPSSGRARAAAAAEVDAGRAAERTFCNDAFSADLDRMRDKCAAEDLKLMHSLSKAAGNLCFSDVATGLGRSRADFDEEAARKCVEMLREKELAKTSESDTLFLHFPCDRVLLGLQGEGQPCRFSIECKDGLACVGYKIGGDGTCSKPPKVKEACTPQPFGTILTEAAATLHHPACVPGAYCDGTTCQPRLGAGKGCAKSDTCAAGLSCVLGKCGARAAAGGACVATSDCTYGLWCDRVVDGGPGRCTAKRAEGQSCTAQDACRGHCDVPKGPDGKPSDHGTCVTVCGSG